MARARSQKRRGIPAIRPQHTITPDGFATRATEGVVFGDSALLGYSLQVSA